METPSLLESKKFMASALASAIGFACIRAGMSYGDTAFIVGPLLAFVGIQGVADIGKPRAMVEAAAAEAARKASAGPLVIGQDVLLKVLRGGAAPPAVPALPETKPIP